MKACRDIKELKENAQIACNLFLSRCEAVGLKVLITETYRSQERQNELYAQGRTTKGGIVTWTKNSRHTSRLAWDICQNVKGKEYSDNVFFEKCGQIAKELGIIWGGSWKTPDKPHFEVTSAWKIMEEEAMTNAERKEFEEIKIRLQKLENAQKVYHYTNELPDFARATIQKLLDRGILKGESDSDLNLSEDLVRLLVINDRAGLYKESEYERN